MTVSIILGPDCELEAIALRSFLEYLGIVVVLRPIGRPLDLMAILDGDPQTGISEFLLFCFHGENGKFIMPVISDDLYEANEPKGDVGPEHIERFSTLNGQQVIATGCTVGNSQMAKSFLAAGAASYTAAGEYPEGNAVLVFVTSFFYHLMRGEKYSDAFEKARNIDNDTLLFRKFEP
ncbi:MAG: hypothetical protein QM664_00440 [Flavihumibacter sp.]